MRRAAFAAVALACALAPGCEGSQPWFGPRVVDVQPAERRTVPELVDVTGRLAPPARVEVRARTEGYLLERTFEDGSEVEQDRILFELQPDAYRASADAARAALARAEADLALAESEVDDGSTVPARRADVAAARARLDAAEAELAYTTLRAPIGGRIDAHPVDVGNLVRPLDLLATIVQLDPIHATFDVPVADLPRLRAAHEDEPIVTVIETTDGRIHERIGRVETFAGEIDDETDTVRLRAVVPNPRTDLLGGQPVTVRLLLAWHEEAVVVPDRALHGRGADAFVWVVGPDDRIEKRSVELGPRHAGVRVVHSGLDEGERVVVGRSRAAVPGRLVRPEPTRLAPRPTPGLPPRLGPPEAER